MTLQPSAPPEAGGRADRRRGVAAIAVTVLLWASAFVGIRAVGSSYSPGSLTFARLAIGTVVLGAVALRRLGPLPRGRQWLPIAAYALMWFTGYNLALNTAEQHLDAGTSALLINVSPILIAVLAGVVLKEGFPTWLLIGSGVAFAGVALIAIGSAHQPSTDLAGVLLCLLAALLAAVSVIVQKPVLRTVPAVQATWFGCLIGALGSLPFAGNLVHDVAAAPTAATWGVVYLGVFPTAVAFTTYAYALARVDAGKAAATTYLVPAITVLLSWLVLGEVPTVWGLAGGAVCLAGVALTRRR